MKGTTEFLLDVSILSPDLTKRKELKFDVIFARTDTGYGNDTYMMIQSRDGGEFEQLLDIRFDASFHRDKLEVYIANWVYSYWTGENGSWNVVGCSIKDAGIRRRLKKVE